MAQRLKVKDSFVPAYLAVLWVALSKNAIAAAASKECKGSTNGTGIFAGVDTSCVDGVKQLITNVTNMVFTAVGIVAVIFIIIGGIRLATSAGNPSGQQSAKKTITNAILGLVVAIFAAAIGNLVLSSLG